MFLRVHYTNITLLFDYRQLCCHFHILGLKKITSDMQTHKNSSLRTGPAPFKGPVTPGKAINAEKPPVFVRDGKKWMIVNL